MGDRTVQAMIVSRALGKRRTAYMLAVKGLPEATANDCLDDGGAVEVVGVEDQAGGPPVTPVDQGDAPASHDANSGPTDQAAAADEGQQDDLWGPTGG